MVYEVAQDRYINKILDTSLDGTFYSNFKEADEQFEMLEEYLQDKNNVSYGVSLLIHDTNGEVETIKQFKPFNNI